MGRIDELEIENAKLREANRRLQEEGPALERDKVIKELRAELRKRWKVIEKMEEALKWYTNKKNLEKYVWQKERYNSQGSWTESGLMKGITKVADDALNEPR